MKPAIILKKLNKNFAEDLATGETAIHFIDEICHTDEEFLKVFKSKQEALDEMERLKIDGQVIELPLY